MVEREIVCVFVRECVCVRERERTRCYDEIADVTAGQPRASDQTSEVKVRGIGKLENPLGFLRENR